MREDYCLDCGCPKDICCGQGKVSLEWLEKYCEKKSNLFIDCEGDAMVWVADLLEKAKKAGE